MIIPRDVVRVEGAEAAPFLQGQLSQDVEGLTPGSSAWSLLLQPQGKIEAWLRVLRIAPDTFDLDVDAGSGEAVVDRLERFKLRVKAHITTRVAVCEVPDPLTGDQQQTQDGVALDELLGLPQEGSGGDDGWRLRWDRLRVRFGVPAMGAELTSETIPEEAGLVDLSVSFTKGCYTGQELVARIDSRGRNVPRRLRRIALGGPAAAGDPLLVDGKNVGTLTTVVDDVALGYVSRTITPPARAVDGAGRVASIEALPPLR